MPGMIGYTTVSYVQLLGMIGYTTVKYVQFSGIIDTQPKSMYNPHGASVHTGIDHILIEEVKAAGPVDNDSGLLVNP